MAGCLWRIGPHGVLLHSVFQTIRAPKPGGRLDRVRQRLNLAPAPLPPEPEFTIDDEVHDARH